MSRSAESGDLEGIDRVSGCGRPNIRLQAVAAHHIDRAIKQTGDVLLQARIIENGDVSGGIDLDHDVGVAVGAVIAAYTRTEKRSMSDTARPQGGFVFPKLRKDLPSVHVL